MAEEKEQYFKFCPKCGSTDITPASPENWLGTSYWDCKSCGYSGGPMEGTVEFIDRYQKKLEEDAK